MNDITIKYNSTEYKNNHTFNIDSKKHVFKIQVAVNDNYDCNDFDISCGDSWVSYKRIRNVVDIIVDSNRDYERNTTVVFSNKLNHGITFELYINQDFPDYSIYIKDSEDTSAVYSKEIIFDGENAFDTLIEKTDDSATIKLIDIKCDSGKPFISATKEYAKLNKDDDEYVRVQYDNGLNLSITKDNQLKIVSFGKANLYYNHYYVVTLKNKNWVYNETTITIKYKIDQDNFSIK